MSKENYFFVLCGLGGLMNTEPYQFPEPGDLGASPLGGSHNGWYVGCRQAPFRWKLEIWFYRWHELERDSREHGHQRFQVLERISVSSQMKTNQKLDVQAAVEKVCNQILSRERLEDGIFACCLCTESRGNRPGKCLCASFSASLFALVLCDS